MISINVFKGDITKVHVDAIVNAANTSLLGGSGVDGTIHRAAGQSMTQECQKIRAAKGGCKVGKAVITSAGKLPCKYIIHTVGPIWNNGKYNEEELLSSAYLNSLILAEEYHIKTIAFPNISTGIYRFPKFLAARIVINLIKDFTKKESNITEILFVCFDEENYTIYNEILNG